MAYVISANYRDRTSPFKWLIREGGKPLDTARACKRVEATDARYTNSVDGEVHWGCRRVLVAETAQGIDYEDEQPLRPLKFTMNGFIDQETGQPVHGRLKTLKLEADGAISADFNAEQIEQPTLEQSEIQFEVRYDASVVELAKMWEAIEERRAERERRGVSPVSAFRAKLSEMWGLPESVKVGTKVVSIAVPGNDLHDISRGFSHGPVVPLALTYERVELPTINGHVPALVMQRVMEKLSERLKREAPKRPEMISNSLLRSSQLFRETFLRKYSTTWQREQVGYFMSETEVRRGARASERLDRIRQVEAKRRDRSRPALLMSDG